MEVQLDKRAALIALSGEMTIYAAAQLRSEVFPLLQGAKKALAIDLSSVTALDTAGLQLLMMFRRIGEQTGHGCRFVNAGAVVIEVLDLCGLLSTLLDMPGAAEVAA